MSRQCPRQLFQPTGFWGNKNAMKYRGFHGLSEVEGIREICSRLQF
jgi:hypothetical protein